VTSALTFLPLDFYDFEALNRDVGTRPMDPILVVYAEYVGTNEAKEFLGALAAAERKAAMAQDTAVQKRTYVRTEAA
jgi:hypothetical protein